MEKKQSGYHWYMLAILTLMGTLVVAIPISCMPVLFKEISEDLGLSLVEIGSIWGIASLSGIFVSIIAGALGDRFGMRLILSVCCILVGITGALRGISSSFLTLMVFVFINGLVRLIIPVNITRAVGIWFRGKYLGMAMGISAMGVGLGLMLGPMISASILSPWLGGWRNVLFLYGALAVMIGVLWLFSGREFPQADAGSRSTRSVPLRQAFVTLARNKSMWLLGLTMMFRVSCIMGMSGYLPLYLRDQGWPPISADNTLAVYYAVSTAVVIPLSILSDRLGSRKAILFPGLIIPAICIGLIPHVESGAIWALMVLAGICMDSFMAVMVTMLLETEGIGPAYSGTAVGIVFTITQIGAVVSPPLGNSLAGINPALAFGFWAALPVIGVFALLFSSETGKSKTRKKAAQSG